MDFFRLSKLLWFVVEPGNLLVLLLILALVFERLHRRSLAHFVFASVTVALAAILLLPLEQWIARPLENRFPRPEPPACVDGILILSESERPRIVATRDVGVTGTEGRYAAAVDLMRRYPRARVVYSGGAADPLGSAEPPDAAVAKAIFGQLSVDAARVEYEVQSRNTWENFLFSSRIVHPKPGEVWLLVASAMHMPRSIGIARRVGWPMLPWPTDYETLPGATAPALHWSLAESLVTLDRAVKEWIGLVAYKVTGRSASFFPAPQPIPGAACQTGGP